MLENGTFQSIIKRNAITDHSDTKLTIYKINAFKLTFLFLSLIQEDIEN